ncbi:MAG: L-threonylcarbamoyladenylate synthase [Patescibacteria group bacterium]|nr:L-threonylcarbamoyladenylate synthase [Patescibacteria group bacterium]
MQTIKIDINNTTQEQIDLIADSLSHGQIIAYPTDTVYGLGCDCRNILAIKKINKIKGERGMKPLLILISDFSMLKKYCFVNSTQLEYLKKIWPGPVTVILKRRPNLPVELTGGLNSLAVRLPDNDFLIKIINEAGFPIVSTSLNKKGDKTLTKVENLDKYFKYPPDLVIDAGECKRTKSSRLVDLRDMEDIKIIRK